jgi:16S rRNA (adenine1518-N6/adenine1519-N6)-dimethyltransferase
VVLRPRPEALLSPHEEPGFTALVKAAFAHRRKTLVNSLRDEGYEAPIVTESVAAMQLVPTVRAETMTLEQFIELTRQLARRNVL